MSLSPAASAAVFESWEFTTFDSQSSLAIPDGDPVGVSDSREISSSQTTIVSVQLTLNISSSFNGDLYVYVRHEDQISILVNRPGKTSSNPFGYADSGLDISLSDSAPQGDIHTYTVTPNPGEPLTGLWQPDGRAVDPDTVLDTDLRTAGLNVFNGLDPNGTWTLYLADLNSGAPSALQSWKLEITSVPEPSQMGAVGGMLLLFSAWAWRSHKHDPHLATPWDRNINTMDR